MDEQFPDPFGEAFSHLGQRITQAVSLAAAAGQQFWDWRAQHKAARAAKDKERERRYRELEEVALDDAREIWKHALNPVWRADADLESVAHAWGAALQFGDDKYRDANEAEAVVIERLAADLARNGSDPEPYEQAEADARRARAAANYAKEAAAAMDACEARLRELHPHAMSHYDRFRANDFSRADAMWASASFFDRDPNIKPIGPNSQLERGGPEPAPRPGNGDDMPASPESGFTRSEWETWKTEVRARAALARLEDRALRADRGVLSKDDLRTALESAIELPNLSDAALDRLVEEHMRQRATSQGERSFEQSLAATAERERAAHLGQAKDDPRTVLDERTDELADAGRTTSRADAATARAYASRNAAVFLSLERAGQGDIRSSVHDAARRRSTSVPSDTKRTPPATGPHHRPGR
jgi:hypothetical protein